MLVAVLVGCEIGFWLLLASGLLARYVLRRQRLSAALLLSVPLVDVVLLGATVTDLRGGADATFVHGLSAGYLGFSVAFGHSMVRWADRRVAHRLGAGPPVPKPAPRGTRERLRYEWREFGKAAVAWAVACGLLALMMVLVGGAGAGSGDTAELGAWIVRLTVVLVVWFVGWPGWESVRMAVRRT
ncbi:hypothetical protein CcI49_21325 [Frankia sp. CcI49]|uniref:hypothetical protein n=1 Tax=unclassified Frankia TaxID=2632575 RepID=UPI0006CA0425|nr:MULTISPECIES: hypothetical protein [unclassified Frankia]KPM53219.1 membrane protein [Frankia sp. R43]ONH58581.1 hypothetical protein CcI49_21325 [Frankia sp. CcI49]